jgi:hypothetical protein
MSYMELGYGGRWYMPSRRPMIIKGVKYDIGKQEKRAESQAVAEEKLPIQKEAITQTLEEFMRQGRIGAGQPVFPGERVAPFTMGQQETLAGVQPFLDIFAAQRGVPFLGPTGGALQDILKGEVGGEILTPQRAEEIFQATRATPRTRFFERFERPLIEEQFAGPGFQSTARAQAVTRAGEELGRDIASEREQFLFGIEQTNRALQEARAGRALSAIPLGMEAAVLPERVGAARLSGRAGVFDFLTQQQQQQQRQIAAEQEVFREAQRFMDPEDFANLATLLGLTFRQETATGAQFFESPLSAGIKQFFAGTFNPQA